MKTKWIIFLMVNLVFFLLKLYLHYLHVLLWRPVNAIGSVIMVPLINGAINDEGLVGMVDSKLELLSWWDRMPTRSTLQPQSVLQLHLQHGCSGESELVPSAESIYMLPESGNPEFICSYLDRE